MVTAARNALVEQDRGPVMQPISLVSNGSARAAYRVVPDPDDPVILLVDGNLCRVLDISASGVSCTSDDLSSGRRYPFMLDLPTAKAQIHGVIDVLPKGDDGKLHCQFVELTAEYVDQLHRYVLVRQKQAIRSLRGRKGDR